MADQLDNAVNVIKQGGIAVIPTDTVYGVAASADLPDAEDRIYRAKKRDRGKPIPLLAACIDDIERFWAVISPAERKIADRFWPGPLTLILAVEGGTEGVRIPAHELALEIIRRSGGVLRVTSANVSGEEPALTADEALRYLGDEIDAVVDGGPAPGGTPSTVARIEGDEGRIEVTVLREGEITREDLVSVLDE